MGRKIKIRRDITVDEVRRARKKERDPKKKERLFAIEQLLNGKKRVEVALEFGVDESTVGRWIRDFNKNGLNGLKDKKKCGQPRKLTKDEE